MVLAGVVNADFAGDFHFSAKMAFAHHGAQWKGLSPPRQLRGNVASLIMGCGAVTVTTILAQQPISLI
jgi:hypothetical protein